MRRRELLAAFALGCVTTALAGWLITELAAQTPAVTGPVHVCVAEDGVMRVTQPARGCPAGQRSAVLGTAGAPSSEPRQNAPSDVTRAARLAELAERIKELESQSGRGELGSTVVAPFKVVDRNGKLIFQVMEGRASFYNGQEQHVASIFANEGGGNFTARSLQMNLFATIGAGGDEAGLRVMEGEAIRVNLGKQDNGTFRLTFAHPSRQVVAAIGERVTDHTGFAYIADTNGNIRAAMHIEQDKGSVHVVNDNTIVAQLTEGRTGGGLLAINSTKGERMVAAGVQPEGFGVVQTGPNAFKPGFGLLGLPGSYIAGKPQ